MRFRDRAEGGRLLAARLTTYANRHDVVVLALPRGGVPVAFEVARALHAPLDVFLVRKLGVPNHPELAMGAIAEGGVRVLSEDLISELDIPRPLIEQVSVRERLELERRGRVYRGNRPFPPLEGRTVITIDDGLATGATMEAAVAALRDLHPARRSTACPRDNILRCPAPIRPRPLKAAGSTSRAGARSTGSAGARISPSARGVPSARITVRTARRGSSFPTTRRDRAPTGGTKTASPAFAIAISPSASPSPCGTAATPS